ncbi:unnamed protein product [Peniophora sp. CBMAI 1063]|nr:unnamed protein product [Peniophora sp. CBMAI 1063]
MDGKKCSIALKSIHLDVFVLSMPSSRAWRYTAVARGPRATVPSLSSRLESVPADPDWRLFLTCSHPDARVLDGKTGVSRRCRSNLPLTAPSNLNIGVGGLVHEATLPAMLLHVPLRGASERSVVCRTEHPSTSWTFAVSRGSRWTNDSSESRTDARDLSAFLNTALSSPCI